MELLIEYIDVEPIHIHKEEIKKLIEKIFKDEGKIPGNISFIIASDNYIHHINKQYLNHDYFTDVISFYERQKKRVGGNIFISLDRIKENSEKYSEKNILKEFYRIVIHGLLHLTGYTDDTPQQKSLMTGKENYYLNQLSLQL